MMSQQEVLPLSIPSSTFLLHPNPNPNPNHSNPPLLHKKKRNLPGTPDPDAEVVALSPKSLMATDRFVCEICRKGFRREQNLQLHRRGHNLPWKLKQRSKEEVVRKKVYVCPEKTCVHHEPSRALGDLTGIKKHFSRKHGEKKWKCQKCSKKYAVQSDWKAHSKVCGTKEYKCDCGTIFSRKDSFITHRAFCDALAEERGRITRGSSRSDYNYNPQTLTTTTTTIMPHILGGFGIDDPELGIMEMNLGQNLNNNCSFFPELMVQSMDMFGSSTANIVAHGTLKEEAEEENSTTTTITTTPTHSYHHFNNINSINLFGLMGLNPNTAHHQMGLTRDFLGVGRGQAMGAPFLHHGSSSSFNTLASALDDLTHYNSAHH